MRPSVAGTKLSNSRNSGGNSGTAKGYEACLEHDFWDFAVSEQSFGMTLVFLAACGEKKLSRVLDRFDMMIIVDGCKNERKNGRVRPLGRELRQIELT